ncbi:hypothetical protein ECG581_1141 [Escherichia coli G58-1]|jgi:hypothetical protein|nr:hypothetical protein ECG581_1141 [Escherichia coli G58-1]EMV93595.1 hypothetical protein EC2865200_1109 [Escherichia coli 2865200]DAF23428.1 MAG TPA: hypothetical protein [Bacteriophage sp.]
MTEASLLTGFQRCAGGRYASVMNKKQSKSTPKNKTSSHINILHWW